jgi:hypothetical protein
MSTDISVEYIDSIFRVEARKQQGNGCENLTYNFPEACVYILTYSSTMNTEVICSTETSVDFHRAPRRYNSNNAVYMQVNYCVFV